MIHIHTSPQEGHRAGLGANGLPRDGARPIAAQGGTPLHGDEIPMQGSFARAFSRGTGKTQTKREDER